MNTTPRGARQHFLLKPLALALLAAYPPFAAAVDPAACVGETVSGNQAAGIVRVDATSNTTLNVSGLTVPIVPAAGTPGIRLPSQSGVNLTVCTAAAAAPVRITTQGAVGISVNSTGRPAPPSSVDALFGIALPGAQGVQGGAVVVVNRMDVTTQGTTAHGIAATSNTDGYPETMVAAIRDYDAARIGFDVVAVSTPQGASGAVDADVAGKVVLTQTVNGKTVFLGYGAQAGTFNIDASGSVAFSISAADFAALNLAAGQTAVLTVDVQLQGKRDGVSQGTGALRAGRVSAQITTDADGNPQVLATWADFDGFGAVDLGSAGSKAVPDVRGFLQTKLAEAQGAGGGGNSVTVEHLQGSIVTSGATAHGVFAESRGRNGVKGDDGGGFWSFGLDKPDNGTPGKNGGDVIVRVDGSIRTTYKGADAADAGTAKVQAAVGVLAHSAGGNGGDGGAGGTYYYGRAGANGGDGGDVSVSGSGSIVTEGRYGVGILAISEGGNGGNGGGGDLVTGGGPGSSGGQGRKVEVIGNWTITTGARDAQGRLSGDDAHGIWARSTGGTSGSGGEGGWLAGAPAPGARATDGGEVVLVSGGSVTTHGTDAFALFGQSVGGFGGGGGDGRNIFSSYGAGGGSAGSGGPVSVSNAQGGTLTTWGVGSHALVAQSIGGGGGAGGSASGIVAQGGPGAYGGEGRSVTVVNAGSIHTHGTKAIGMLVQSIGGGGGDGGDAGGLASFGGGASGTSPGGTVTVTHSGRLETEGIGATGIFAQSIGGGGGNGGSSSGWFSVGGSGGGGGDAGTVTVNHGGTLITRGEGATGLFAQSVGGGGGKGGASIAAGAFGAFSLGGSGAGGGSGKDVTVNGTGGSIETFGLDSHGLYAQSVGGGGGDGGFAMASASGLVSLSVAVGGSAGQGGNAGQVTVQNHADITTRQAGSVGLFAESVGGGGGNGGFAISGAAGGGVAASLALGGSGKGGGYGEQTWVENSGRISTAGKASIGLQAQSVGGGGGNGGLSLALASGGLGAVSLSLGGTAGGGGIGKLAHVYNEGAIGTDGLEAHAMLVQSIGGGGGNGGLSISDVAGGFAGGTLSLGGTGGTGGAAGAVEVENHATLDTRQAGSVGLFAQSVGGGGGNGGFALSGAVSGGAAINFTVGGSGGSAGKAGTVNVENHGAISSVGAKSVGLQAQSVGGGGGNGGFALDVAAGGMGALGVTIGGKGANGGIGDTVTVGNDARIDANGAEAHALLAQSVGGGGGNGGFVIGLTDGGFASATVTMGGAGGQGSAGGLVEVTNSGALRTHQAGSVGLLAQSVGGGGGNGGFAVSGAAGGGAAVTFAMGGGGALGGDAGEVKVHNLAGSAIGTAGAKSIGLQAQSIGGGGGNGGFSVGVASGGLGALNLTMGGSAGGGGAAKAVSVTSAAAIDTDGAEAHAMLVQSVGGGGGNGGFSIGLTSSGFGGGTIALGGKGGSGADAGTVYVENTALLQTRQAGSVGLFAQSLGGGGGNGGFAISGGASGGAAVNFALGGSGAGGGDGKLTTVVNEGRILTAGDKSIGLQAQSLGGGGGNGGFAITAGTGSLGALGITLGGSAGAGGNAARVDVTNRGAIDTDGVEAHAMFVQSVGGGGGNGGFSIGLAKGGIGAGTVTLGGDGGGGGEAGVVDVENHGALHTQRSGSVGLFAQSVGGGGGNGGFAISAAAAPGGAVSFALGGSGAGGGHGNEVGVTNHGGITTDADGAIGLQAQSVGGGGGNGGFSIGIAGAGVGALGITLGGSAADGGNGRKVEVHNHAVIETAGLASHAMFVQSIGGGGGKGGFSVGATAAGTGAGTFTLGGGGGAGGTGGVVIVENTATLLTHADQSVGLYAQSVGGGGGNGGFSIGLSGAGTGAGTFNLGGAGATGGDASSVTVTSHGDIGTDGLESHGVFAQSVGGGGGNGGFAIGASGAGTGAGTINIGGSGKGGGNGQLVHVDQRGLIVTGGEKAVGVFAQSVGGGGGNGGFSIGLAGGKTASGTLTLGGYGEGGGAGGSVEVASAGEIHTAGREAHGLQAQSLGGGGGNGGFSMAGAVGSSFTAAVSIGGSAGEGGAGQSVHVDSASLITTQGNAAHAIFAQSVGGGGGNGGMAVSAGLGLFAKSGVNATVTVGGTGGQGGQGGEVVVGHEQALTGTLATQGKGSHGIFAQSVGGGGGQGGAALGLTFGTDLKLPKGSKTLTATFTFGGSGGDGNIGGDVTVNNASTIVTRGTDAHGIFAQSVGGGGGSNGGAETVSLSTSSLMPWKDSEAKNFGLAIEAGGDAGHGNAGGLVTVTNDGNIVTTGTGSRGIFAQSVGGGGGAITQGVTGAVGDFVDDAQNVLNGVALAKAIGDLFNKGDASGLVPSSLSITLGASGGNSGDGKAVSVTNRAAIVQTQGLQAHAILAQSIGAGGGDARAYADSSGEVEPLDTGVGLFGEFVVGGEGGAAGSGGAVTVDQTGSLLTLGAQAHGIFAQSVGGGGGAAGAVAGGFAGVDSIGLNLAFGRKGGSGGNGGAVTVTSAGAIETHGERAIGILAQSVGGGGGAASERSGLAFFGSVGGYGSGGAVNVTHEGSIVTEGDRAHGIFAQSAGGRSGTASSDDGSTSYVGLGGIVNVTLRDGGIDARGALSDGILAQSRGDAGQGDISVTVEDALVRGGRGAAAGVRLLDGTHNRVDNRGGWITTQSGIDGLAIVATGGNDQVHNAGRVTGSVDLGAGRNGFDNRAGARLEAGATLALGAGNVLANAGQLSPLGRGRIGTTALSGDLAQSADGRLEIDLDVMAGTADRLDTSGTATLAGAVDLVAVKPAPAQRRIVIVSADEGLDAAALDVDAARSAVAGYSLVSEGRQLLLDYRIDFGDVAGLNGNQRRFGAHVNAIQAAGSTEGFAPIADVLFAQPDAASLAAAYDRLGAEPHVALGSTALLASLQFGDAMLSCRRADGESRFVREGECGWLSASAGSVKQAHSDAGLGFSRSGAGLSAGFQRELAPGWHAGLALGVEHAVVASEGFASARGDQVQAGATLKWRAGDTTVSGALELGRASYQAQRSVTLPGGVATARSTPHLSFGGAQLRVAHAFVRGDGYLRPMLELGATQVVQAAFGESGAGAANLSVLRSRETFWTLRPALEWGGEWRRGDGTLMRPYLRAGVLRRFAGVPQVQATLQGVPTGVASFTAEGALSRTLGELGIGLDLIDLGGGVLRFGYAGQLSHRVDAHSASLKVSMPF